MPLRLAKVLKHGYKLKQQNIKNYIYDKDLSNDNEQVYYNRKKNKLLYNVSGTHNLNDWGTDVALAFGRLKSTKRYKEADEVLKKAKEKYKPSTVSISGHSLGGSIAGYIAKPEDNVYTLDKGATIGQKVKKGEHAYRTAGDVVSLLNAGSTHMSTLKKPSSLPSTLLSGVLTAYNPVLGLGYNALTSHDVKNIKKEKIYV